VILNDPALEQTAIELLRPHVRGAASAKAPAGGKKKPGFFGWFSKK